MRQVYTIGHSNHEIPDFIRLLHMHHIDAVCDVRSAPYSKHAPQFNCDAIGKQLQEAGIRYVYLGKELGPRSDQPSCYIDGKVRYDRLAETEAFKEGIERLKTDIQNFRVALMCSEKDPLACHRTILVCRHLRGPNLEIRHILKDGRLEAIADTEKRLMAMLKIPPQALFDTPEAQVKRAYNMQGERIAYTTPNSRQDSAEGNSR
jgi:uncharacterized protein (DUF488 family)